MAENLAYLPKVNPILDFSNTEPRYYVYNYDGTDTSVARDSANYKTYGVLYNWTAAMASAGSSNKSPSGVQGICPSGWHLPSDAEWTTLINYVGSTPGSKLKTTSGWDTGLGYIAGTDVHGFSALPGGFYNGAYFDFVSFIGRWWTATENSSTNNAYYRGLVYNSSTAQSTDNSKSFGFSVRCLRN